MDQNKLRKLAGLPQLSKATVVTENAKPNPRAERELQQLTEKIEELIDQIIETNSSFARFLDFLENLSLETDDIADSIHSASSSLQDVIEFGQHELDRLENDIYNDN